MEIKAIVISKAIKTPREPVVIRMAISNAITAILRYVLISEHIKINIIINADRIAGEVNPPDAWYRPSEKYKFLKKSETIRTKIDTMKSSLIKKRFVKYP